MTRETTGRLRYCLVTPAHLCNNPRLVKEADALHAAGHDVRVVSLRTSAAAAARDATVMATRGWRLVEVDAARDTRPVRWMLWATLQRLAQRAFRAGLTAAPVRDLAVSRFAVPLAAAAGRERADVYVAHNLEALAPAAWAAKRYGVRLGFDVEDLHEEQLPDTAEHAAERARTVAVQRAYLSRCALLTAAAPAIADEIARRYGVRRPVTVLNAFPASERAASDGTRRDRVNDEPALYWFSQTLGADRGIEEALDALAAMRVRARLYLRGDVPAAYRPELEARIARLGLEGRVHLLPLVPPGELVARSAEHDVGLALEQPRTVNRDICVTNKLFVYMLAGLAVVATDTRGQREIAESHDAGIRLYAAGDAVALARELDALLGDRAVLAEARARASAVALGELSWERERERLVRYLESGAEPQATEAPASEPAEAIA